VCVVDEPHLRALDLAGALDVHLVVGVDHDLRDRVVAEERLERAVAEDVVRDLADDPPALFACQRCPVERELLRDGAEHPIRDVAGRLALEQLGAELGDARVVDLRLQVGIRVGGSAQGRQLDVRSADERDHRLRGAVRDLLLLREAVVETHRYALARAPSSRRFFSAGAGWRVAASLRTACEKSAEGSDSTAGFPRLTVSGTTRSLGISKSTFVRSAASTSFGFSP